MTFLFSGGAYASPLVLSELLDEALKYNHDLLVSDSTIDAARSRVPQSSSLPDPMFMFGYQNEGWKKYTYGEMQGAQWMFSASQTFPFPGKLGLKEEMALQDAEGLDLQRNILKRSVVRRVSELYFDLFLAYKSLDLISEKMSLYDRIEEAALARYASGTGMQQDVLMAQTERYMLLEREAMLRQKVESAETMLNASLGRDVKKHFERPAEPAQSVVIKSLDEMMAAAENGSPDVKLKEKMASVAETKVRLAEREYYPDFTLAGSYFRRTGDFLDMWSLTTTVNIPIFYRTKQRAAVREAEASYNAVLHEAESSRVMAASRVRDSFAMYTAARTQMDLYKNALVPKSRQDFESSLSSYSAGKIEALNVLNRLKSMIDYETAYWERFVDAEKAVAGMSEVAGNIVSSGGEK